MRSECNPRNLQLAHSLQWRHNERVGISNHRRLYCLSKCLFRRRSKISSKLCITALRVGNSPVTREFPAQRPVTPKMFPFDEVIMWWPLQYIPRNMHTVFALLCFVVVIHWLIFTYPSGLLHWHCGNLTIAPVPAKQPWWIWINTSCEFIMNNCITTTKQSTTKPCAYFLGCTVVYWELGPRILHSALWQCGSICEPCYLQYKLTMLNKSILCSKITIRNI